MAVVISIINQKGGVAKTTTAFNLAHYYADKGLNVLAVDIDSQANLSESFGFDGDSENPTINDFLLGAPLKIFKVSDYLDLIPSSINLAGIEIVLYSKVNREKLLDRLLQPIKENYDIIIIDCPPSLSILTMNALATSDYAVIPLSPSKYAYKGLNGIFEMFDLLKDNDINTKLMMLGIVLTKYDQKRVAAKAIVEKMQNDGLLQGVFDTKIRKTESLVRAEEKGESIFVYDKNSAVAKEYADLGDEILSRIKTLHEYGKNQ